MTPRLLAACALALAPLTALTASPAARMLHDPEERLVQLNARIAESPRDAKLYLERGQQYHHPEDLRLALQDFDRALALDPDENLVYLARARALFDAEQNAEALRNVERFLDEEPGHGRANLLKARALRKLGRVLEAAQAYNLALEGIEVHQPQHILEAARAWADARPDRLDLAINHLEDGMNELGQVASLKRLFLEIKEQQGIAAPKLPKQSKSRKPAGILADPKGSTPVFRSAANTLIAGGSSWRYFDNGVQPGGAWTSVGYDDSGWGLGGAPLGYGEGDEVTTVDFGPSGANKYTTTYYRHSFSVANPATIQTLLVGLTRDDGAIVYLNGTEIARSNLDTGTVQFGSFAQSEVDGADERRSFHFTLDADLLVAGTNVIAAEVHQDRSDSPDHRFDLELYSSAGPAALARGPYLQLGTPTSATIRWRTVAPTATALWGGTAPGSLQLIWFDAAPKTEHILTIPGLKPETKYFYAVGDGQGMAAGNEKSFFLRTPPVAGKATPTRVWIIGDSGNANGFMEDVRDSYYDYVGEEPTDVWLMLGDNAYASGTQQEYQEAVFDMFPTLLRNTFLWPSIGNHDTFSSDSDNQSGPYFDMFSLPANGEAGGEPSGTEAYYSFDHGNIHFICLDSQGTFLGLDGSMYEWLVDDLDRTNAKWVIAFWHHPPYTKGSHNSDNNFDSGARLGNMRRNFLPLLESAGVDLVLCGHSHSYERSYLLDGHYGTSQTLLPSMLIDQGNGAESGDGAYLKGPGLPNAGSVYVVAGNASSIHGGALDHPAMCYSASRLGSLTLDINGNELDAVAIDSNGNRFDRFTIRKRKAASLTRVEPRISAATGGTQNLLLDAGPAYAGREYAIAGSLGVSPGFTVGAVQIPLNQDAWFRYSVSQPNSAVFQQTRGTLDADGRAQAAIQLPVIPYPGLIGSRIYHAFVVLDASGTAVDFVSNPVWLTIDP